MEANPYNLRPVVGSINASRSNFSFVEKLSSSTKTSFGKCEFFVGGRKAQPPSRIRGDIARIYRYMNQTYPGRGIISKKRKRIFERWEKSDPVSAKECLVYKKIEKAFTLANPVMEKECTPFFVENKTSF